MNGRAVACGKTPTFVSLVVVKPTGNAHGFGSLSASSSCMSRASAAAAIVHRRLGRHRPARPARASSVASFQLFRSLEYDITRSKWGLVCVVSPMRTASPLPFRCRWPGVAKASPSTCRKSRAVFTGKLRTWRGGPPRQPCGIHTIQVFRQCVLGKLENPAGASAPVGDFIEGRRVARGGSRFTRPHPNRFPACRTASYWPGPALASVAGINFWAASHSSDLVCQASHIGPL